MSGHSHYSTIKRKKETTDAAKGKIFSRHASAISLAIKEGGGANPDVNTKLRFAIEQAKSDNVPKDNIQRILKKAIEMGNVQESTYEGYGPKGIAVVVETVTNNKNRTAQEIKYLFEKAGGSLAGPGAVSYNFEPKTLFVIQKSSNVEEQILNIIDLGVEDVDEADDGIEVYVNPSQSGNIRKLFSEKDYQVKSASLIKKPKMYQLINNEKDATKALSFLETLEAHQDVQNVFTNMDIPQEVVGKIT